MGVSLRPTPSPSRRANSTGNQSSSNNSSSNHSRSINNSSSSSSGSSGSSSSSSTRKISRSRKTRSRSTSITARNNYYLDNPYRQRQPVVMMVPNSLLPVSAYFPRDYIYEFEDEGYDSASSSDSESPVPVPALGWRPTQGTLEMEFMFGDMDEEFMQELTRESTPSSDDDEVMMGMDTYASGSSEEAASMYDHQTAESEASAVEGGHDSMGGRVVDEDYD